MQIKATYQIAHAAGRDAADTSMKAAGRTAWSRDDYNVFARLMNKLLGDPRDDREVN